MMLKEQLYPLRASPRRNRESGDYDFDDSKSASLSADQIPAEVEERAGGELNGGEIADIIQAALAEFHGGGGTKTIPADALDKIIAAISLARLGTPNPTSADDERWEHRADSDEEAAYNRLDQPEEQDKDGKAFLSLMLELLKHFPKNGLALNGWSLQLTDVLEAVQDALPRLGSNPAAFKAAVVGELAASKMDPIKIGDKVLELKPSDIVNAISENRSNPSFYKLLLSGDFRGLASAVFTAIEKKLGLTRDEQASPDAAKARDEFLARYRDVLGKVYAPSAPSPSSGRKTKPENLASLRSFSEPAPGGNTAPLDTTGMTVHLES